MFDALHIDINDLIWGRAQVETEPEQEDEMDTTFENMLDGLNTRKLADLSNDELDKVKWAVIRSHRRPYHSRVIYVVGTDKVYDDVFYEKPTEKAIVESFVANWEWQKQQARERAAA